MSNQLLLRLGAACGIGAPIVGMAGFTLLATSGSFVPVSATEEQVARILASPASQQAFLGLFLESVGQILLLVFAARVWLALRQAEGEVAWLAAGAFGSGLLLVATGTGAIAPEYALALGAGHGLGAPAVWPLHFLNMAFYVAAQGFTALFLALTATVTLKTRALPRWLGWSGLVLAAGNLLGRAMPTGDIAQMAPPFFYLWLLTTGIVLLRQPEQRHVAVGGQASMKMASSSQ
jgi:hypothetical protein